MIILGIVLDVVLVTLFAFRFFGFLGFWFLGLF